MRRGQSDNIPNKEHVTSALVFEAPKEALDVKPSIHERNMASWAIADQLTMSL